MAGVLAFGSGRSALPDHDPSSAPAGVHLSSLELQYHSYLMQGLAPSWLGRSTTPPLRSIIGVRALHIEQGFSDPLQNCLRLQWAVRGIKYSQGLPSTNRLPITDSLMLVIWKSLDLHLPDHCMFWAACTLGYFGFLRSAELTVPTLSSFSPKTDLFCKGCVIYIGLGCYPLCTVHAVMTYPAVRGDGPGPLFLLQSGKPLSCAHLISWLRQIMASAGIAGNFSSHSFRSGAATVAARNGILDHLI